MNIHNFRPSHNFALRASNLLQWVFLSEAELAKRAITAGASEDAENLAFTNLNNYAEEIRLKISTALRRVNQI